MYSIEVIDHIEWCWTVNGIQLQFALTSVNFLMRTLDSGHITIDRHYHLLLCERRYARIATTSYVGVVVGMGAHGLRPLPPVEYINKKTILLEIKT